MKNTIAILTIILFAQMTQAQKQSHSFEVLWEKVEQLEKEELTKSALNVVATISKKAGKENNTSQKLKALLYTSKYSMTLEEDAQLKIISNFNTEITKATFPTKNVLESYLANLYWQYFQQNRYQFYNRTHTETKVNSKDFRTWDLTTLFHEINLHFSNSLKNPKGLQQTPISEFSAILHQQENSKIYRPTLFDILAHTALDFYKTNENNITRPANKFEIKKDIYLCDASMYISEKIKTEDSTSLEAKALIIYQQLLSFHLNDKNLDALVLVDIDRLNYIHNNSVSKDKDATYLHTLLNNAETYKKDKASALYAYEIASLYQRWGNSYNPTSENNNQWKLKEAHTLCQETIHRFPKSYGAEKCKALKANILDKSIHITTEEYIPINTPAKILVRYKNHENLALSAVKITKTQLKKLNETYPEKKQLAFIQSLKVHQQWNTVLKNESDYQTHSSEILIPKLENGHYLIVVKSKDDGRSFAFSPLQITNLALIETRTPEAYKYQIIDRTNGEPKDDVTLKFSYRVNYDGPKITKTLKTDTNGFVKIPLSTQRWSDVNIEAKNKGDKAFFGEFYINRKYDRNSPTITNSCFLFTDRSIYRPGQPLYFKGIAISKEKKTSTLLKNTDVIVTLRDANYQEIKKLNYKTNDFGSFSGEFVLPSSGLTGNFSIYVNSSKINLNGYTNFSVEEYKRPKFETSFIPISETYKINDSIKTTGKAIAYAGSNITNAKVSYRVKRVVYFPRWYYWHYRSYNNIEPQEIAHGETTTNDNGLYEITFKAIPDNSLNKEDLPTFSYEVTADVTDINGETHSTSTIIQVGYHSLTANINVANLLDKENKENSIHIYTQNLNGSFVPAKGNIKIFKLKAPNYVLRQRPWTAPDYNTWNKEEFKNLFPHESYTNEHSVDTWEKGEMVWENNFNTEETTELKLKTIRKWESGKYIIELETKDKFGNLVKDVARTTLFSAKDKKLADNQLFHIQADKSSYSIGDNIKLTLFSNVENIAITLFVEKNKQITSTQIIHPKGTSKTITIPVEKNDLGGFSISYSFAAYNSFSNNSLTISVPYPKKDLEIETLTFRDKLQPGTEETWSFKVKGAKGEKVSAELLASMYDASLDSFRGHNWSFYANSLPYYYSQCSINGYASFNTNYFTAYNLFNNGYSYPRRYYDTFQWFGLQFGYANYGRSRGKLRKSSAPMAAMEIMEDSAEAEMDMTAPEGAPKAEKKLAKTGNATKNKESTETNSKKEEIVVIRKNLQETAFFFPHLNTDKEGNVTFSFVTPEALTKWKLQLVAHSKTLESATATMHTVTQKELMVTPNTPRFLREGDAVIISSKIANLTSKKLTGSSVLKLTDVVTGEIISKKLIASKSKQTFTVDSLNNTQVSWKLQIPEGLQGIQYTIIAKAGDFSDGEQNALPVLSNRMLVTETLPMWVRSNATKNFSLDKLRDNTSTTLKHHKLTLEITSNPAWYAVQALPYLMEYPYECNEQTFSRYYANTLASHIANSNPRIQEVFKQWATSTNATTTLVSTLEKNQELKSLLIQETPWLRDAQSETEQKKRIALLFNLNKMLNEQASALIKLQQNQMSSGAWSWFKGGRENRFITQHIISGLGHLKQLNVTDNKKEVHTMLKKAIGYLDKEFVKEYEYMKKHSSNLKNNHLSSTQIHYLYMRSFFTEYKTSKKVTEITKYYLGQTKKYWKANSLYRKGMLALISHRAKDATTASKILRSLKENSITSEELGMYWKENTNSWYWYQAPIETQALLIEAFSEIENNTNTIDNLKIWLLKNKQTNQWKTTKATTEAVYALLLQGSDWLSVSETVDVLIGGNKIAPEKLKNVKTEAGTGYYKTTWNTNEIDTSLGKVSISKKGKGIAWGALYWQYFEDLDKITSAETPLQLKKKLFLKKNTDTGEQLSEINSKSTVKVGDLVRIRIELKVDRTMQYIHMKDMRAAGFEPINVFSQHKWQDGLGYYESTKDASTNFFFDYLPKGIYIFEYDLRVNNAGDFSNGITTIQSMYAPEFSSHSKGVRVKVE
ncbi:MG2 domain-containing protein [uncultured Maribacter sp.]|uniref:alpha-2-macroglobulin family protein n=1 Tax=uncultured Maribacter sp. TaxID=431308 RepID=UPI002601CE9E|nr:MG2 domain-containing protein [uncultured Maribacter sp.]